MSAQEHAVRPNMFPCIGYRDERRASDWLNRAFGFERHAIYEGPDGTIVHAELRLGPGIIMLGRPPEDERGTCFYVYVEDVDAHCERAVAAGAEIVRPLHDTRGWWIRITSRPLERFGDPGTGLTTVRSPGPSREASTPAAGPARPLWRVL